MYSAERSAEHLAESSTRASKGKVQERGWVECLVKLFFDAAAVWNRWFAVGVWDSEEK